MKKLMMVALCALGVNVARAADTRDYLSFTATDGDVTIGMEWGYGTPTTNHTFEWSADKANWTEFLTGRSSMTVPATAEQGFMLLKSKGADPSNRSGRPDTADIQHD